ncbi:RpiB/LacA/LacB family sugar-phosphate isomerase [Candidatus Woesearchaeota archaeon]|nr:RpiB/LacA/LacB family sugar-phosphate isomerase [Candidatus Woesearchaeota archaeon]MBW3018068.1 RpiB/LacA/LacB family sugar-phosphate isomerase [Candidatus Woesearchaeota archaeon]
MIVIGADHGGFELKEKIKKKLDELGYEYEDVGAFKPNPKDDYPQFAERVGRDISEHPDWKGILICRSGQGMAMVANKFSGVRAAVCHSVDEAKMTREHNDANVLSIGADDVKEKDALAMVQTFLETLFSDESRHKKRVAQINKL